MQKIQKQVRQGDVLLVPVATIPDGARAEKLAKDIILAEGEVTGHRHIVKARRGQVKHYRNPQGELYLRVLEPVPLTHQEHGTLTIDPGDYLVRRQVETWMDEVRQVAD